MLQTFKNVQWGGGVEEQGGEERGRDGGHLSDLTKHFTDINTYCLMSTLTFVNGYQLKGEDK